MGKLFFPHRLGRKIERRKMKNTVFGYLIVIAEPHLGVDRLANHPGLSQKSKAIVSIAWRAL